MKTNQILLRPMGEFKVQQRTKDSFFNATELLKQWNQANPEKERQIDNFWKSSHLPELMSEIAKNEYDFKSVEFRDLKKLLSSTRRGKLSGGTWMHPILFIKFAMYLNPSFEYHVIKFVYDQMIHYRNEAGDAYRGLSSAIQTIVESDFMPIAMRKIGEALNWIVFNEHERMLRNKYGEESKQRELWQLEKKIADLISEGFVKDYTGLIKYLRFLYAKKHCPEVFRNIA